MAQLKVKQISDFVSAITNYNNANAGTAAVNAISVALSSAKSHADVAEADAKTYASNADASLKTSLESYADQAEADAKSFSSSADVVLRGQVEGYASDADVVLKGQMESYADAAEADAIASAKAYSDVRELAIDTKIADGDEATLNAAKAHSDIQKGRIDTLLAGSAEALDTFKEIEDFIGNLSTADINGLIADISAARSEAIANASTANASLKSSLEGYADAAEADAIASAKSYTDGREVQINLYADQAEADAIASAKSYTDGREVEIKLYADAAEADAVSSAKVYTDGREVSILSTLRGEISDLAGVDKTEQIANFVSATTFVLNQPIALENNEILVFVNGLQVHAVKEGVDGFATADGLNFEVSGLGYDLEGDDHIVVVGVLA